MTRRRIPRSRRVSESSRSPLSSRRAFHAALEEAFAEHWEYQPQPFEKWWERQVAKPDHDPSLWFLVRTGEDVVAATRNDPERSGGGWIGALGVRPAWRGRGLAKALLLHSFREFHRRGQRRVGLGVDSENATGATKLYESVGMVVDTRAGRLGEGARMNIRPFTDDDAPVVAALISAEEERLYGRPGRLTGADILMFLHWSKEEWVWEEDGRMVASATYGVHGDAADIRGIVADKGRGLGDGDHRSRRGVRARGATRRRSFSPRPSPMPLRVRSSSRAAIARCAGSTRWRSS